MQLELERQERVHGRSRSTAVADMCTSKSANGGTGLTGVKQNVSEGLITNWAICLYLHWFQVEISNVLCQRCSG
jgi:hypothetical protein